PALDPEARAALASTPLFAKLPPKALEDLIPRIGMLRLEPGEFVFREGEAGAALYIISEGEVTVETAGRELARLGPSAFFGEIALVTELPRSATVRAATRVELLSIDRDVLRAASAAGPEIVNVVLGVLRDRLIDRLARTSDLFWSFSDAERSSLAKRFELVEVARGTSLVVQDHRADGLYVMLAGRVEVRRSGDAAPLAELGSGDVFGEMSLLSGGGSVADVRAISRVLALRMKARVFQEVIMTHPQVLEYLGALADARQAQASGGDASVVGVVGVVGVVDLHLDLL
ncbi:MAG: cyclic nucleotide-binding domain-containing protein, partial [Proteobacteria bacterium]|nr:cyclic nucleotide-binding domain-containing protein [Pseudomonadota bacterium]